MELRLKKMLERETEAIPCPAIIWGRICNGYADKVDCTKDEIKNQNCGSAYECCIAAFLCRNCKTRIIANLEAPECNW